MQIAAAQEQIAVYRERERLLARTIQTAEQAATELSESARASAEEILSSSQASADEIIRTAQDTATRTLKEARAAADEMLRAARAWAEATLEDAGGRAQREVDASEKDAARRIEPLHAAADRLAADAERMVREMEARLHAAAEALSAKVDAFEAEQQQYSQGLVALIARHTETLERVTHLQTDVQERLIPAFNRLTAGLKSSDTSWLRPLADKSGPGRDRRAGVSQTPTRPVTAPATDGEHRRPPSRTSGEVTVRHVSSFRQAAQLVRALGMLHGVGAVRLRTYASGEATFDVTLDHGTLAALDIRHLDGFSLDVVEVTSTRLVLQIERRHQTIPPG